MYESFYGLSPTPFRLTPDPLFFYEGVTHKRGLAFLRYAFLQKEGFVVITGTPGTGKTELMLNLINELPRNEVVLAKVVTSNLGADDLIDLVAASFLSIPKASSKGVTLKKLEEYFYCQAQQGKQVLLLIDEAHNLHIKSLIELSMLSNFQVGERPVLQCFLMGQEPLGKTLDLPELAHLKQRVIVSTHLEPLSQHETRAYIEHRLTKAGWKRDPEFTKASHSLIFKYSEGIPRKINAVCNRILLEAYLDRKHIIDHRLVFNVIREILEELGVTTFNSQSNFTKSKVANKQAQNTLEDRQHKRLKPQTPSATVKSTDHHDETPFKPDIEPEPAISAGVISAEHTYTHDPDESVAVAKLPSVDRKADYKPPITGSTSVIPNNVTRLNTRKRANQKLIEPVSPEKITPRSKPNIKKTSQRRTASKQASNLISDKKNRDVSTQRIGLIDIEINSPITISPDTPILDTEITKPQIDPQQAVYKKIIIDELAQDQGKLLLTTADQQKEYERLSTYDTNIDWSPISKLGITISVISLFMFWWFIYGPGLDTTLEALSVISNTVQNELKQLDI